MKKTNKQKTELEEKSIQTVFQVTVKKSIYFLDLISSASQAPFSARLQPSNLNPSIMWRYFIALTVLASFCQFIVCSVVPNLKGALLNPWESQRRLKDTLDLLFPNSTQLRHARRQLQTTQTQIGIQEPCTDKDACPNCACYTEDPSVTSACNCVKCEKCENMVQCKALNGFMLMETYYPEHSDRGSEICYIIDRFAGKLSEEIFGIGRTFRDTPQCREIVMQYLCLTYGSDNTMYVNHCAKQELTDSFDKNNDRLAPPRPCRSFCVQIVTACANTPELIQTCYDKGKFPECDNNEGISAICLPDPSINQETLAARLGCNEPWYPYDWNPYFKAAALSLTGRDAFQVGIASTLVLSMLLLFGI